MRNLASRRRVDVFLLVALTGVMLANVAWPDVQVGLPGDDACRFKVTPETPCGTPTNPANFFYRWPQDYAVGECTEVQNWGGSPPDEPRVYFGACYNGGDDYNYMISALGGACAGGTTASATAAGETFASVGLYGAGGVTRDAMMRIHVERIVTLGPVPDIVNVSFLGGGLQTRTVAGGRAEVTLKLIVYPNVKAANADSSGLAGAGSAFFGKITLLGDLGTLLPLQGFSVGDFLVANDGGGTITARPVLGLVKTALVPDARTAVVSMVGDPRTSQEAVLDVSGNLPNGLALAPAKPNPFSGNVAFRFNLPETGPVSLEVFDLLGRHVRSWRWDGLPAGEHAVTWNGRTDAGARAPAGTLLLRLSAMGRTITQKAVLLP